MRDLLTAALYTPDFTGPRAAKIADGTGLERSPWHCAYQEFFRPVYHGTATGPTTLMYDHSSACLMFLCVDALPIAQPEMPKDFMTSLHVIQDCLSGSASDIAKMLQVSRQMIYHYREGMEPAIDNYRRMKLIANIVTHVACELSLEPIIKLPQPEGKSLLGFLSEDNPDVRVVQGIVRRANADLQSRQKLANLIAYATPHERRDIARKRHAQGKPIYVSDPSLPGKIVQIRPDQSRATGRMINRVFVPDEG